MKSRVPRIQVAPSILACDFLKLGEQVREAERGGADRLHIDVMDGRFVPNISIGQPIVECIRSCTSMVLETHLMIVEPERYISEFAESGADLIIVHQEVSPHAYRTLQQIHAHGKRAGVALNPGTPLIAIQELLELADLVLVMTVNPGFGGQAFLESMMTKIGKLRDEVDRRGLAIEIEVDGGIDPATAAIVAAAGARVLVAGTAVYRAPEGVERAIHRIRAAADAAVP